MEGVNIKLDVRGPLLNERVYNRKEMEFGVARCSDTTQYIEKTLFKCFTIDILD